MLNKLLNFKSCAVIMNLNKMIHFEHTNKEILRHATCIHSKLDLIRNNYSRLILQQA